VLNFVEPAGIVVEKFGEPVAGIEVDKFVEPAGTVVDNFVDAVGTGVDCCMAAWNNPLLVLFGLGLVHKKPKNRNNRLQQFVVEYRTGIAAYRKVKFFLLFVLFSYCLFLLFLISDSSFQCNDPPANTFWGGVRTAVAVFRSKDQPSNNMKNATAPMMISKYVFRVFKAAAAACASGTLAALAETGAD
jgi:hypothetical protein